MRVNRFLSQRGMPSEFSTAPGTKAEHITPILVFAKMVEVDPITTDRSRRTVAL